MGVVCFQVDGNVADAHAEAPAKSRASHRRNAGIGYNFLLRGMQTRLGGWVSRTPGRVQYLIGAWEANTCTGPTWILQSSAPGGGLVWSELAVPHPRDAVVSQSKDGIEEDIESGAIGLKSVDCSSVTRAFFSETTLLQLSCYVGA